MPNKETTSARSRKEVVRSFLQMAAIGAASKAFDLYAAPNFRHHNPYFRGDAQSLARAMEENAAQNPDKTFHVERVIEEGELVAVHSRVRLKPGGSDNAVVHIFRFENDRVAELWDIGMGAPEGSPNENGMF
jgi:predicted SnoaL-like aldol condensation-catalyzing enzyme